jgi:hypothetical protein
MKSITRVNIYLATTALVLTAVLAVPAAAQKQVPFKGSMHGNDTDTGFTSTTVTVLTTGSGNCTRLGQFTFTLENTVDITNGTDSGFAHFIAANGDIIDATFVGSGEATVTPDGVVINITETYTITGGTGRFEGAEGIFIMERVASPVTFLTSGSFQGTITSPGTNNAEADED